MSQGAEPFDVATYEFAHARDHEVRGVRITGHAVERFIQRWSPGAERDAAREALLELVAQASPTREKTFRGHEIWGAADVRFVVKRDAPRRGRAGGPIVVTVLPAVKPDRYADQFDEFMSWWEEHVEYRNSEQLPNPGVAANDPDLEAARAKKRQVESEARARAAHEKAEAEARPRHVALVAKAKSDYRRACEDELLAKDLRVVADELAKDAKARKHAARDALKRATRGEP